MKSEAELIVGGDKCFHIFGTNFVGWFLTPRVAATAKEYSGHHNEFPKSVHCFPSFANGQSPSPNSSTCYKTTQPYLQYTLGRFSVIFWSRAGLFLVVFRSRADPTPGNTSAEYAPTHPKRLVILLFDIIVAVSWPVG